MGRSCYIKPASSTYSSRAIVFYEQNQSGIFDGVIQFSSTSAVEAESALNSFRLAIVPTTTGSSYGKVVVSSHPSGIAVTDHGLLTCSSSSTTSTVYQLSSRSGSADLVVIDDHGTHIGTPQQTNIQSSQVIGVKHSTTEDGYVFRGIKVTLGSGCTLLSTGGTTEGDITTFLSDYAGAIVVQMGSLSRDTTIEFLYGTAPITKTIALDPNEGTVTPTSVECTGTYANAVAITPTRSGYLFLGWFDNASGGNEITAETEITASSPSTIYAHWEEVPVGTYAITYVLNGGTGGPQSTTVTQGGSYTIPSDVPTKESYTFDGWLVGSDTTVRQPGYTFTPEGDTTISAKWSGGPRPPRPSHQLDYMVYGGGGQLNYSISGGALVYAV